MFFYVEPGEEGLRKAFKKCGELMTASPLRESASDYIGDQVAKILEKHKVIHLDPGAVRLFTRRNPPRLFKGPLLVAFTRIDQLEAVILANPGADIVFLPWTADEMDFFVKKYAPTLI